jgi:hypothetical protein
MPLEKGDITGHFGTLVLEHQKHRSILFRSVPFVPNRPAPLLAAIVYRALRRRRIIIMTPPTPTMPSVPGSGTLLQKEKRSSLVHAAVLAAA